MLFFQNLTIFNLHVYLGSATTWKKRITNRWCNKHQDFLSSHDIRLRTITMGRYASNQAKRSFVTFFLLNARLLLSMRLKFYRKRFLTDGHVEQQKKKFQVDKWASKRARLLFTTSCSHPELIFLHKMLILWISPIQLFVTAKKSGWVRCYCNVQSGFCLKI